MITKIAKIYANALIDDNSANHIKDLEFVQDVFAKNPELKKVLQNPTISFEQKLEIIDAIFKDNIGTNIINYLKILTEKKHISEIPAIIEIIKNTLDESNGIKAITIISALELTKEYKEKITTVLENKIGKQIKPNWQIDENIIAGLVIKIDDDVIDTSIKTKLEKIKGNI